MNGSRRKSIRYEPANVASFAAARRALADVLGQLGVGKLTFFYKTEISTQISYLAA